MSGQIDFSKCRSIALRGYNGAGVWQTAYADIKNCNVNDDNQLIVPKIVVDVKGEQQLNGGMFSRRMIVIFSNVTIICVNDNYSN